MSLPAAAALAWGVSLLVGLACMRWGALVGFIDRPDRIKTHTGAAVPLGGIAVVVGLGAGLFTQGTPDLSFAAAAAVLVALGLVDDRRSLDPRLRLVIEVVAAVVLAFGLDVSPGYRLAVVVAVVVMVNAINLIDGIDLLGGLVTAVALGSIGVLGFLRGLDSPIAVVGTGAVVGFLVLNRPPARLFLGDNGAYLCGLLVVAAAIEASEPGEPLALLTAVSLASVPLFDLGATVLRRLLEGAPLFAGDRNHTYDRVAGRIQSGVATAAIFASSQLMVGAAVILVDRMFGAGMPLVVITAALLGAIVTAAYGTRAGTLGRANDSTTSAE